MRWNYICAMPIIYTFICVEQYKIVYNVNFWQINETHKNLVFVQGSDFKLKKKNKTRGQRLYTIFEKSITTQKDSDTALSYTIGEINKFKLFLKGILIKNEV